ncbi:MAG: cytochrome C [Candidatus Auribacter fodinae]|uniref:Cytochrome C n=1 Tax=Candidatus Auribacter fodinae TaxID=2093366 RepID=A0A3A4R530_9BACT|nr:MAG: cytochrome C [Candidatus Auribacter fodinae]
MKKFLKWIGIILAALSGLIILALAVIYFQTESRLNRVYAAPVDTLPIPTDAASIEHGRRIFQYRGCEACHGEQLQGKIYLDDPALGQVIAGNLTRGEGGYGASFSDADWVRAIRYGVRPDGTPLLFMPSTEFYFLSDDDLADVIAYIKSVPPVDHVQPPSSLSLTGRAAMTLVPAITFIPAELIPMDAPRPVAPEAGVTAEYGEYLTLSCKVCHGLTMSGGLIPGFPSDWPPAPNLTWGAGSSLPAWEESDFIHFMRTGMRHGSQVDAKYMPWSSYKFMTDDELRSVWVYLQSLPPLEYGNR